MHLLTKASQKFFFSAFLVFLKCIICKKYIICRSAERTFGVSLGVRGDCSTEEAKGQWAELFQKSTIICPIHRLLSSSWVGLTAPDQAVRDRTRGSGAASASEAWRTGGRRQRCCRKRREQEKECRRKASSEVSLASQAAAIQVLKKHRVRALQRWDMAADPEPNKITYV